jgi:ABC-type phosphate transport system substrate-binding protein
MRALLPSLLILACCLFGAAVLAQPPPSAPYQVIVHPGNPASSASRRFLSDAFLKKITRWDGGTVIRPVDQNAESGVRRRFSEDVLKRSVNAVRSYWQQVIFSGRDVPPPELRDDAEVLEYVTKHEGAVGYVSGGASTTGVKVLSVR